MGTEQAVVIDAGGHPVHAGASALEALAATIALSAPASVVVLADAHTAAHCLPELQRHVPVLNDRPVLTIPAGEASKSLDTCARLWGELTALDVDRNGLLVCLGGGVVTDLGGFVAATYKRGIRCAHVPTSLMGMVDAAIGGKTAIDLQGVKNLVGVFHDPVGVYVHPPFLRTLPARERTSGVAEMLKHGLVHDADHWHAVVGAMGDGLEALTSLVPRSAAIKAELVKADPRERGVRKLLNCGHSIGHGVESTALETGHDLLHGEAVAIGLVAEAWVAVQLRMFAPADLAEVTRAITRCFSMAPLRALPTERVLEHMRHDKKNAGRTLRFALPTAIGRAVADVPVEPDLVRRALDHCRRPAS